MRIRRAISSPVRVGQGFLLGRGFVFTASTSEIRNRLSIPYPQAIGLFTDRAIVKAAFAVFARA